MMKDVGGISGSRPTGQAPSGLDAPRIDPGRVLRDAKGHFAEWRCVGGHDACCQMYPGEDCPTCEPMCRRCRQEWRNQ